MADWMPLYKIFSPIMLPRFFRIFEMMLIFGLYYFLYIFNVKKNIIMNILLFFISFQILRILFSFDFMIMPFRLFSIFTNFGHFLFFFILIHLPIKENDLNKIINFYRKYFIFNLLLIFLIIFPLYNFQREDILNGTYQNSHIFGVYLYLVSNYFFYKWIITSKIRFLFLSFLFLILQYFPSNEKIIILNILMFIFLSLTFKKIEIKTILLALTISFIALGIILLIGDILGGLRLGKILKILSQQNIGFILSWPLLLSKLNSFIDFIFGIGPGFYASRGAIQLYKYGYNIPLSDVFKFQLDNPYYNSAYQILWNILTNLIGEYGIIGLLCYIIFTYYLILLVIKSKCLAIEYKVIFISGLASVIYQDLINSTGFVEILIFPLMLVPALAYKSNYDNEMRKDFIIYYKIINLINKFKNKIIHLLINNN